VPSSQAFRAAFCSIALSAGESFADATTSRLVQEVEYAVAQRG
jgi:hypothetical protein